MSEHIKKIHEDAYFIQLHEQGRLLWLNTDSIVMIAEHENGTQIYAAENLCIVVDESFREIAALLFGVSHATDELTDTDEANLNELFTSDILDEGISVLDLSVRSYNCLRRHFFNTFHNSFPTVRDVCKMTPVELMKVKNLGKRSYEEIVNVLHKNGFGLGMIV